MRVAQFLADHEVPFETVVHAPAYTAQRQAHLLHVSGRRVAKSVLLSAPSGLVLAVLPASHRIELEGLAAILGEPLRLASPHEIADLFRDCEWGALTPFGRLYGVATIVDEALDPRAIIVFAAQSHFVTIRMHCRDFERLESPRRLRFARRA